VECSLRTAVETIISVDGIDRTGSTKASGLKSSSSSSSSKSVGKLYYTSSSSSVCLLECLLSDESGGEESSDWPSDKSGKSNRPPKVAIDCKVRVKKNKASGRA
jgi:hypothetical protein